jgi:aspartate kinase
VLHPRTIQPVALKGIPVRVRSTFEPALPGTLVDGRFTPGSHPVKAIGAVRDQDLISVEGKGMAGVPGIAERVFGALARGGISVTMISQSNSETSICFAIPERQTGAAELALKREFRSDLARGDIEEIAVRRHAGLVAAVGLGMVRTPGVAARVCGALAARKVNILAIAQGSSELNLSLAVDRSDVEEALRAIHHEFGLDRLDTGEDTTRRFDLIIAGTGRIGRALARQIFARRPHIRD